MAYNDEFKFEYRNSFDGESELLSDDGKNSTDSVKEAAKLGPCHGSNLHLWTFTDPEPSGCKRFGGLNIDCVALGGEHILVLTSDGQVNYI